MIKFGDIKNDILKLKINKVCLVQIGLLPDDESLFSINENNQIDGIITIKDKSYHFICDKIAK